VPQHCAVVAVPQLSEVTLHVTELQQSTLDITNAQVVVHGVINNNPVPQCHVNLGIMLPNGKFIVEIVWIDLNQIVSVLSAIIFR